MIHVSTRTVALILLSRGPSHPAALAELAEDLGIQMNRQHAASALNALVQDGLAEQTDETARSGQRGRPPALVKITKEGSKEAKLASQTLAKLLEG